MQVASSVLWWVARYGVLGESRCRMESPWMFLENKYPKAFTFKKFLAP
jgi:hypothetical protein